MRNWPAVSVVVPTHNRKLMLLQCLGALQLLDYPGAIEIIVVDDGSTDGTQEACARFEHVKYVFQKNSGRSIARNVGIAVAQHDIVVFTDDDCLPEPEWLKKLVSQFSDEDVLGVSGRVVYVSESYVPGASERVVENPQAAWPMTANIAYRKSVFLRLGGFNETFDRYEDKEFALRAWKLGKIVKALNAVVYHQKTSGQWPDDQFISSSAQWVRLKKMHRLKRDKNNPAPIAFGIVLMPKQYLAMIKRVLLLPFYVLRIVQNPHDKCARWELQWLRFLILERVAIWRMALSEKVFLV